MCLLWFRYDFDMILIWFWYAKDYDFLMVLESLRFLIWFWYDFLMVLESLRFLIWFWYDFLMVLESLRFLDMIFLWFWGASVFLIWFRYCFLPATFPTPVAGSRPHLPPPLVGPQPHLPPLSPDSSHTFHPRRRTPATPPTPVAGPTSHPVARQWNQRNSLISNFGFFLILLDLHGRCSMLQTYRVQFEHKLYHFVGEAGKKKRFSMLLLAEFRV